MERFQRTSYLSAVSKVRRELAGWIGTYRTMLAAGQTAHFTSRQLAVADRREGWLEDIVCKLEEVEEALQFEDD